MQTPQATVSLPIFKGECYTTTLLPLTRVVCTVHMVHAQCGSSALHGFFMGRSWFLYHMQLLQSLN